MSFQGKTLNAADVASWRLRWAVTDCSKASPPSSLTFGRFDERGSSALPGRRRGAVAPLPERPGTSWWDQGTARTLQAAERQPHPRPWARAHRGRAGCGPDTVAGGRTTQGPRLRRSLETLPQRRAADRRLDGGSGKTPLLSLAPAGEGKWGDCRARGTGSAPTRTYRGECTASGRSGGDSRRGDPPSSPLAGRLIRSACAV